MIAQVEDQIQHLRAYLRYLNNKFLVSNWEEEQRKSASQKREPVEMLQDIREAYLSLARYELHIE